MDASQLNQLEDHHSSGAYVKRDLQIVRGEGAYLFDAAGNRYIDCVGGQGSTNLGHAHPAIVEAIQSQAAQLISCPELFHNPIRAQYQAALCQAAKMPRIFLCNSGAEANEGAIKIAKLVTGRSGIVATMRGFHGRTNGALSLTWEKRYREPFAPLLPDVTHVPYNKIEKIENALTPNTAAVIVEVVQGEGGVHPAQAGYLQAVQAACHANGSLLIVDEVQTGFGRTGTLFAHWQDGIQPDLMTVAKSIAAGVPMGAVLMGERVGALPPATHGSTFGGNPLACAVGLAALAVYQSSGLVERALTLGAEIRQYWTEHLPDSAVRAVRGRGFMFGIELRDKVGSVLSALQDRGIVALPAGRTVLRLLPPLVMSDDDLWHVAHTVTDVLSGTDV